MTFILSAPTTATEGTEYEFTITPTAALADATMIRWVIVPKGALPVTSSDFPSLTGMLSFTSGATTAQTVTFTPTDDARREISKDFELRIYDAADMASEPTALDTQVVTLRDNDDATGTYGNELLTGNGDANIIGFGTAHGVIANGSAGSDFYVISRFQYGNVEITDTVGTNLVKFDAGVTITDYDEESADGFVKVISRVDLTLSTGAVITIINPVGKFVFQLGSDPIITTYDEFKGEIRAEGSNETSTLRNNEAFQVLTATTDPDISGNSLSAQFSPSFGSASVDIFSSASTFGFSQNGSAGDDFYVISRFQYGNVEITDTVGTNLIKFDVGVTITDYDEESADGFVKVISRVALTLSTGAVITIINPVGKFVFQLGDDDVIATYDEFKGEIRAEGSNETSTLRNNEAFSIPIPSTASDAVFDTVPELALAEQQDGSATPIIIGTVAATDADDDPITYRLTADGVGEDSTDFAIDENGQITYVGTGVTHASIQTIMFTVVATSTGENGEDTDVTQRVTIAIEAAPADAVFDTAPTDFTFVEQQDGSATPIIIGTVMARDVNDDTIAYRLTADGAGEDSTGFAIDTNGQITYIGTGLSFIDGASTIMFTVVAQSTGADGSPTDVTQSVTIEITRAPADAVFATVPELALLEQQDGSATAIIIGTVMATDVNDDMVTYRLTADEVGEDATGFEIDTNGQITYVGTGLAHASIQTIMFTVVATSTGADGSATDVRQSVTIEILQAPADAVFDALPSDLTLRDGHDGSAEAIIIGTVAATDVNDDMVTYRLTSDEVGEDATGFEIDGNGQITYVGTGLSYASSPTAMFTVVATSTGADGSATDVTQSVTIDITENTAPSITDETGRATITDFTGRRNIQADGDDASDGVFHYTGTIENVGLSAGRENISFAGVTLYLPDGSTIAVRDQTYSFPETRFGSEYIFVRDSNGDGVGTLHYRNFSRPTGDGEYYLGRLVGARFIEVGTAVTTPTTITYDTNTLVVESAEHQDAVTTLSVTDTTPNGLTWMLSGADAALFEISDTGEITWATTPDYEMLDSDRGNKDFRFRATATDGSDASDSIDLAVTLTDGNDAPVITTIVEDFTGHTNVFANGRDASDGIFHHTVVITRTGLSNVMVDVEAGGQAYLPDGSVVDIQAETVALPNRTTFTFHIWIEDRDGDGVWQVRGNETGPPSNTTFYVLGVYKSPRMTYDGDAVTDVSLVVTAGTTLAVDSVEHDDAVITLEAADPESDALAWTLTGGADIDSFNIDRDTGAITWVTTPDFDTTVSTDSVNTKQFEVTAKATDTVGVGRDEVTLIITLLENTAGPVIDTTVVAFESVENHDAVATLSATDESPNGLAWTLTGGADMNRFAIDRDTGAITWVTAPEFDTEMSVAMNKDFQVTATVTDGSGGSDSVDVTITLLENTTAPIITSSIIEDFTGRKDINVNGVNGNDGVFHYSGRIVVDSSAPTHPNGIRSRSVDLEGVTLYLPDGTTIETPEGRHTFAASTVFYHIWLEDPDDDGVWTLNQSPGARPTGVGRYYLGQYDESGRSLTTALFRQAGTAVQNEPVAISPLALAVESAENQLVAAAEGAIIVTDTTPNTLTWSLEDAESLTADARLFNIDENTGEITWKTTPDYETLDSANSDKDFVVTVRVTDGGDLYDSVELTITLTNVNDAPIIDQGDDTLAVTSLENQLMAVAASALTVSDDDMSDTLRWSLEDSGSLIADARLFNIDEDTGELTWKTAPDYETLDSANGDKVFRVTVTVTDDGAPVRTDEINIEITLTDGNDAPIIDQGDDTLEVNSPENQDVAVVEDALTASDVDMSDALSWSLTGGADVGLFNIDEDTGEITWKETPDFEETQSAASSTTFSVTATVTDDGAPTPLSDEINIEITLTDGNDAPVIFAPTNVASLATVTSYAGATYRGGTGATETRQIDALTDGNTGQMTPIVWSGAGITSYRPRDADGETLTFDFGADSYTQGSVVIHTRASGNGVSETQIHGSSVQFWHDGDTVGEAIPIESTATVASGTVQFTVTPPAGLVFDEVQITFAGEDQQLAEVEIFAVPTNRAFSAAEAAVFADTTTLAVDSDEGQTSVTTLVAMDADMSDTLRWSLTGGADIGMFNIDANTGEITWKTAPDFEDASYVNPEDRVFSVTATVTDDGTPTPLSDEIDIEITLTDVNEVPIIDQGDDTLAVNSAENELVAVAAGTLTATDVETDSADLRWSLTGGDDVDLFDINSETGEITWKTSPDYDDASYVNPEDRVFSVTATVTDDGTPSRTDDINIEITLTDENDNDPVIDQADGAIIMTPENRLEVTTLTAMDLDTLGTLAWSLTDDASGLFTIDSMTGEITWVNAPDYEDSSYTSDTDRDFSVMAQVTDGLNTDSISLTIRLTDANDAPVISIPASLTATNIAPDADVETSVTAFRGGSGATADLHIAALTDGQTSGITWGGGSAITGYNARHTGGETLTFTLDDDYTQGRVEVYTRATPNGNGERHIHNTVVQFRLDGENVGDPITIPSMTDVDADIAQFTVTPPVGLVFDEVLFTFPSNGDGSEANQQIAEVEIFAILADGTVTSLENQLAVTAFTATDIDAGDTITWTLEGADHELFQVAGGVVTWKEAPDFEELNSAADSKDFSLTVVATDVAGLRDTIEFIVILTDANDAPIIDQGDDTLAVTSLENELVAVAASALTATDPEGGTLTWSLTVNTQDATASANNDLFDISADGEITWKVAPDYEAYANDEDRVFRVTATVTDDAGTPLSDSINLEITLSDVNDAPIIDQGDDTLAVNSAENQDVAVAASALTATDDETDSADLRWSLTGGVDIAMFAIDTITGEIMWRDAPDFESIVSMDTTNTKVFSVTATVTDDGTPIRTDDINIEITLTDVNEASPIIDQGDDTLEVTSLENQLVAVAAGTLTATDTETASADLRWSLTGGDDVDLFDINSETGEITWKVAPDYEDASYVNPEDRVFSVIATVTDDGAPLRTDEINLEITLTDENDAPIIDQGDDTLAVNSPENQLVAVAARALTATDDETDSADLRWSLTGGADIGRFNIDEETGEIRWKLVPNLESTVSMDAINTKVFSVTATVTDDGAPILTDEIDIEITLIDVNDAPVINTIITGFTGRSNYVNGVDDGMGVFRFSGVNWTSVIIVSDDAQAYLPDGNIIDIPSGRYTPTGLSRPYNGFAYIWLEQDPANAGEWRFNSDQNLPTTSDPFYVLGRFNPDNGHLSTSGGLVRNQSFTIELGSAFAVDSAENQDAVITLGATDAENDAVTWTLTDGVDVGLFNIGMTSGVITWDETPNYEDASYMTDEDRVFRLTATATDARGAVSTIDLTVTLTDVNEASPIIDQGDDTLAVNSAENQLVAVAAGTLTATDTETDSADLRWSLTGGADRGLFNIDSATGEITWRSAPDFEETVSRDTTNTKVFSVTATVTDDGAPVRTDDIDIEITLTNVSEAPVITHTVDFTGRSNYVNGVDDSMGVFHFSGVSWTSVISVSDDAQAYLPDGTIIDIPSGSYTATGLSSPSNGFAYVWLEQDPANTGEWRFNSDHNLPTTSDPFYVIGRFNPDNIHLTTSGRLVRNEQLEITPTALAVDSDEGQDAVITLGATDERPSGLTWVLSGDDMASFEISDSGVITWNSDNPLPDFDTTVSTDPVNTKVFDLTATVTDDVNLFDTIDLTITLVDVM